MKMTNNCMAVLQFVLSLYLIGLLRKKAR